MTLLSMLASAETVVVDGIRYNLISKGNVAEVTGNSYKGDVSIPPSFVYDGIEYRVTSIGENAFVSTSGLVSVTLPNTVSVIRSYAFRGSGLASIVIPNSVTYIEKYAFYECYNLKSATISNNLSSIGFYVFGRCGLTSVTIPESVTEIENSAFFYCSSLQEIVIPSSVTAIGGQAFSGCSSLSSLEFEEGLTNISSYAFKVCMSLQTVTFPNSLKAIGSEAFLGCGNLTEITLGKETISIESNAFGSCPNINKVTCLARSVPSTSAGAFANSYIESATLCIPSNSIDSYNSSEPWKSFETKVSLILPEKCATPTITKVNNKISFSCETEGVEYSYEITNKDVKKGKAGEVVLGGIYQVSVYATKEGYEDSDVATQEFTFGADGKIGDIDVDGNVNAADIVRLVNIIMNPQ